MSSLAGEHDEPNEGTLVAARSDVGRVRVVNEDSCGSYRRADGSRLLIVADGMGGHRGGATASREALAAIAADFEAASDVADPGESLRRAIERANERVYSMSEEDPGLAGMGTTVVAFLLDEAGRGTVAHVGDSRAYRLRGRRLEPQTTDHSVVAEMLRRGVLTAEEAAYHPRRNEILRSVGVLPDVDVEVGSVELAGGDWILLCSDGLCGVVSDAEIEEVLVAALATPNPLETAADALVELANECGGPDNVTVQLLALPSGWRPGDRDRKDGRSEGRAVGGSTTRAETAPIERGARSSATSEGALAEPVGVLAPVLWIVGIAVFVAIVWWIWRLP